LKKTLEGYFSLEAALVFPMVLWVILFIIYLLFFQYDRCLMEQDMGILALRGTRIQAEDNADRIQRLRKMEEETNSKKYYAWEMERSNLSAGKGKVSVERQGKIKIPFINSGEGWWSAGASYEHHMISPVTFIRAYRRLEKIEEGNESEEGRN